MFCDFDNFFLKSHRARTAKSLCVVEFMFFKLSFFKRSMQIQTSVLHYIKLCVNICGKLAWHSRNMKTEIFFYFSVEKFVIVDFSML